MRIIIKYKQLQTIPGSPFYGSQKRTIEDVKDFSWLTQGELLLVKKENSYLYLYMNDVLEFEVIGKRDQ